MEKHLLHHSSPVFYKVQYPKGRESSTPEPSTPAPSSPLPDPAILLAHPTILLVHGFAEDGRVWDPLISEWEHTGRLIIPDLPGSGRSEFPVKQPLSPKAPPSGNGPSTDLSSKPSPPEPIVHAASPGHAVSPSPSPSPSSSLSLEELAEALIAILDQERIRQCILIGHSMGGYIGLALAEKYPERLLALGLFHSTACPDSEERKEGRRKNISFILRNGSNDFVKQATPNLFSEAFKKEQPDKVSDFTKRYLHFDPRALTAYTEAMMNRPDRTRLLSSFHGPVLFISGEKDPIIPLAQSLRESHLPAISHIHILEHSAHMGMLEEISASRDILQQFVNYFISGTR